jgi:hypothetical protein
MASRLAITSVLADMASVPPERLRVDVLGRRFEARPYPVRAVPLAVFDVVVTDSNEHATSSDPHLHPN